MKNDMSKTIKVKVPATTANLGPGFDIFGAALSLYNELEVSLATDPKKAKFVVAGEGRKILPKDEYENHPARYALVEIVNLHSEALEFEPIHRVVFGVNPVHMMEEFKKYYEVSDEPEGQKIEYVYNGVDSVLYIKNPKSNLAVGSLQMFIDEYIKANGGKVDYIHGDEVTKELGGKVGNIGFLLPNMKKTDLFKTVILDGALPRKTFSMGHSYDKRYYLEARKIK